MLLKSSSPLFRKLRFQLNAQDNWGGVGQQREREGKKERERAIKVMEMQCHNLLTVSKELGIGKN